jgi:hypothetical protein
MHNDLRAGDQIVCGVRDDEIQSGSEGKGIKKIIFEILTKHDEGYIIYIPSSLFLKNSKTLTKDDCRAFGLDIKFLGSSICHISTYKVLSIHNKIDGMSCIRCNEFCHMVESNQEDGKSFKCFLCRTYRFR